MGFRFRRSVKLFPGVRLNLGKRGASVSVGPRGAKLTIGPTGTRATIGIPGTGISYTEKVASRPDATESAELAVQTSSRSFAALGWMVAAVLAVIVIAVLLL